ncbi:MAG: glycosyltransferase, partial [Firmicutes bacterium]|nr:glycosyltransferase [Bacillota bacterium]
VREDALTTFTTKGFAKFYGFPDAPIIRAAVGENLDEIPFQSKVRGDWLLFVGKMDRIKGPHTAINWARALNKTVVLFGPVSNRLFFNTHVRTQLDYIASSVENTLDLAKRVPPGKIIYGGLISRLAIWDAYLEAGITIVPSQCEEAMSRVVQEAMLTGCPVIATDRGGIFESMGEGIGGRVVTSIDEVLAADKTLPQWYDPQKAREHILTTRTPEVMTDSCDIIYNGVAKWR